MISLVGAIVIVLPLFLLASGRQSDKRHEEWRRAHGFPPRKR